MCRKSEQDDSVYGADGRAAAAIVKKIDTAKKIDNQPRFRGMADTPNERLTTVLQEALDIAGGMDRYLTEVCSPATDAAAQLGRATETAPWGESTQRRRPPPLPRGMLPRHSPSPRAAQDAGRRCSASNAWTTDVVEGTLAMFAYMLKAKRVMEIGMFTGYGALTIAEVLPADGKVVTCEIDPFLKEFSRPFFDKSPHGHKVDVRVGPALATMKGVDVAAEGGFDMIFIDADKGGYAAYYEAALSTPGLLNDGGVIVVDNTLFKGQAYLPAQPAAQDYASWNAGGAAITDFNKLVADDPRVEQVTLPVRDGITIVRRAGGATPAARRWWRRRRRRRRCRCWWPRRRRPSPRAWRRRPSAATSSAARAARRSPSGCGSTARWRSDGAGQGIGRAFAHARRGGVGDGRRPRAGARGGGRRCSPAGGAGVACAHRADVADEAAVKAMVEAAVSRFGALHIAVNNAGVNKNSAAEETPIAEFDLTFGVNTRGVFMCCQHEARHMLAHGGGKIINTASMASLIVPHPQKQAAYNASKSAVVKLTQSLGCEWASRGVNVNCISPGIVDTPLIWDNPALKPLAERWVADMPIGKLCDVTDLQAAIVYLASEASDYMVGHNLVIEGGQSLW